MNDCGTKEGPVTTQEMIEYLQAFAPESELKIFVIDTHEERKCLFRIENLLMITDEEMPVVFLDIDRNTTHDITDDAHEDEE